MHIHDALQSEHFADVAAVITQPSNLLAAAIAALTASLCYAKIAPAALHCGKIVCPGRDDAEAAGRHPEFRQSDSCASSMVPADRPCARSGWFEVEQGVPDA
jgi:hypothetical protein